MTWFKVDDGFHSHPKALASTLDAIGLWTIAGSWSSNHLTDGHIPDHVIAVLCRGNPELADLLCDAGLWHQADGGYQFHGWDGDADGTRRNPTKEEVIAERLKKAEAGRKGGLASAKSRQSSTLQQNDAEAAQQADAEAPASGVVEPPTRPDPTTNDPVLTSSGNSREPVDNRDDDELSTVPDETWDHYARLMLEKQPAGSVKSPTAYKRKIRRTAKDEKGEQAQRWWRDFNVQPRQLAEWLADDKPSPYAVRREETPR